MSYSRSLYSMNLRLIEGVHERSLVQRVSLGFVTVVCTMCARACDQNLNPGTRTAFRWPTQDLAGIVSMRGEVRGQQMQYMHWCRPVHFIIHALCGRRDKDATNFSRRRLTMNSVPSTHSPEPPDSSPRYPPLRWLIEHTIGCLSSMLSINFPTAGLWVGRAPFIYVGFDPKAVAHCCRTTSLDNERFYLQRVLSPVAAVRSKAWIF